jgi:hypothetical protein
MQAAKAELAGRHRPERRPTWAAGPAYMPWAGGFFDVGLLPCLFLGSVLGSGFGMFGGARAGDAFDGGGDFAEFGGGDL